MTSTPLMEQSLVDSAEEFRDSMEALYELVTLVNESSDELDGVKASFDRRMLLVDPSLEDPGGLLSAVSDALEKAVGSVQTGDAGKALGDRDEQVDSEVDADSGIEKQDSGGITVDLGDAFERYGRKTVLQALDVMKRVRRRRSTVALNSLLVAAVGEFEALCSKCIQGFITTYPGKLTGSERKFTFEEVSAFGDLEAFKARAADLYAENIMRGSVDDWLKWFSTNLRISVTTSPRTGMS